jgi:hypothetical protein
LRAPPSAPRACCADDAAEFDDPRVEPLIQRFIPNEKWRQEIEQRRRERGQKAQQK